MRGLILGGAAITAASFLSGYAAGSIPHRTSAPPSAGPLHEVCQTGRKAVGSWACSDIVLVDPAMPVDLLYRLH